MLLRLLFALCMGGCACNILAFSVVYAGVWPPWWVLFVPLLPVTVLAYRCAARRGWFE